MVLHFIKCVVLIVQAMNVTVNCEWKPGFHVDIEHVND